VDAKDWEYVFGKSKVICFDSGLANLKLKWKKWFDNKFRV
jgi:hypothetical protein